MMLGAVLVGVFGLFHPAELDVRPAPSETLILEAGATAIVLEGGQSAHLIGAGDFVECIIEDRRVLTRALRGHGEFVLSVPGKIQRRFRGGLEVAVADGALVPVVAMDLEIAVASAVAAESPPGAPLEALKAQAVVTRSYYLAGRGRHAGFQFCDTTHCQFLRQPPAPDSPAAIAAAQTRNLLLSWRGAPLLALFTASCGGRTRSLVNASPEDYPYFPVECAWCRRAEPAKCSYCIREAGLWANRRGRGAGHGFGLCQTGAAAMAAEGAIFDEILSHYFPNTRLSAR